MIPNIFGRSTCTSKHRSSPSLYFFRIAAAVDAREATRRIARCLSSPVTEDRPVKYSCESHYRSFAIMRRNCDTCASDSPGCALIPPARLPARLPSSLTRLQLSRKRNRASNVFATSGPAALRSAFPRFNVAIPSAFPSSETR